MAENSLTSLSYPAWAPGWRPLDTRICFIIIFSFYFWWLTQYCNDTFLWHIIAAIRGKPQTAPHSKGYLNKCFICCFSKYMIFPMPCETKLTWTPPYRWGNRKGHVRRQINQPSRRGVVPETEPSLQSHTLVRFFTNISCCSANRSSNPYRRRKFSLHSCQKPKFTGKHFGQRWYRDNLSNICKYRVNVLVTQKKQKVLIE